MTRANGEGIMSSFVKVAKISEIPEDTGKLVQVGGQDIALFKVKGKVHAIFALCPHQGGPLDEGGLNGKLVTCPWHGWEFDVTNGLCGFNPAIKTPTFEVKEQNGDVYVKA